MLRKLTVAILLGICSALPVAYPAAALSPAQSSPVSACLAVTHRTHARTLTWTHTVLSSGRCNLTGVCSCRSIKRKIQACPNTYARAHLDTHIRTMHDTYTESVVRSECQDQVAFASTHTYFKIYMMYITYAYVTCMHACVYVSIHACIQSVISGSFRPTNSTAVQELTVACKADQEASCEAITGCKWYICI